MKERSPVIAMALIFISVQAVALLLVPLFPSDYRAFEDVDNPANPLVYVFLMIVITAIFLILIKYGRGKILRAIFLGAISLTLVFVLLPLVYLLAPNLGAAFAFSITMATALIGAMLVRPEWYTINLVAFVAGCGVTALLGMSLGILPAIILLAALAVYDAIAVYGTKHMVTLAEGILPLDLPVLFVVPKKKDFSLKQMKARKIAVEKEEREAMLMGVGDAVIPGILVVSAFVFLPGEANAISGANFLVSLGSMIGGILGFVALMALVQKGRPHAGLPLLNGGTLAGFFVSYLLVFQNFGFGVA